MGKLVDYFAGHNYRTERDVLEHCQKLTPEILNAKLPRRDRLLGPFSTTVLEVARSLGNNYTYGELRREVEKKVGNIARKNLRANIYYLRRHGHLSTKPSFIAGRPKLRSATDKNLQPFMPLVNRVLRGSIALKFSRFRRGNWKGVMSENEARSAVLHGLRMAYERASDPTSPSFPTYAIMRMAGEIGTAMRNEFRRKKREGKVAQSVREQAGRTETGESSVDQEELIADLHLLLKHPKAKPHHNAIYALRKIFGHRYSTIARRFGVERQTVLSAFRHATCYIEEQREK